ncbi:hypothetical protein SORDD17_01219 [Streptococcus oralis]|uniref:Uncharacterized protein n=1 Tax=Streptococcus oralis TaxID=1303 RepID=A0A139RK84_STROR|nr:hypothetical protein [Streptococcus oralis]KXU15173.1 hypothetical protein SORDD17_01219 [Streptococcus oralis]
MKEKYYNVKEALEYIRSYPSGRIEKEFYMDITEKQIRDILKKDVLGKYRQLSEGEQKIETYINFKEKEVADTLYVFPKFGKNPKIFSSWDSLYKKEDKLVKQLQRQGLKTPEAKIREEFKNSGKPAYLMSEDYLFSLKLEIERRQLPIEIFHIHPRTSSTIKQLLNEEILETNFELTIRTLLEEFQQKLKEAWFENQKLWIEQAEKVGELLEDVRGRTEILQSVAPELSVDAYNSRLKEVEEFYNNLKNQKFTLSFEIEEYISKFKKFYMKQANKNVISSLAKKIYEFEKYQINKNKEKIKEQNKNRVITEISFKRYLVECYKNINDSFWRDDFLSNLEDNFGIKINR